MNIVCLDLEGVLIPEIWLEFAEKTGIEGLKATTRDIPDYDELMGQRLSYLNRHGFRQSDIQAVVNTLTPLEGARAFLDGLRESYQVIILSDTFYEFAMPLMGKLNWPTLFCHRLEINAEDRLMGYRLRQQDPKRKSVRALHALNFKVLAAGDSYNDLSMLEEADAGFLFRAPENVVREFPQYPVTRDYGELRAFFDAASEDKPDQSP